jgi:predicted nucleotide-binding protein (sugar kinase/HSP70/actin superfamily)
MQSRELPPEEVIFFMPTACGPCRFGQYARLAEIIFDKLGWQGLQIMSPSAENAYAGLDTGARKRLFHAIVASDVVRKLGHRVRPYEREAGETDAVVEEHVRKLEETFARPDHDAPGVMAALVEAVKRIPVREEELRPLVGVVGEIYVRSDPFINMDLCRRIEALGGEAWLAPIGEWIFYTAECTRRVGRERGSGWLARLGQWIENHWFHHVEETYYGIAEPILHDRREPPIAEVMAVGEKYLPWQFEGEAVLTLGRAELFVTRDGADAVVNASPMFCMPGTITTSIFPRLEKELGVPVVCNFYDGSGDPNEALVPTLHYLTEAKLAGRSA